ncbi:hypothetical protein ACQ4WQ_09320 [Janthinobacterium sp. GB1R12]|uniref:hypothetical protein n=1 Tax=Janthinobacterium sp. GB1R12 TaxID=3424190 RepID=UPI003F1F788E
MRWLKARGWRKCWIHPDEDHCLAAAELAHALWHCHSCHLVGSPQSREDSLFLHRMMKTFLYSILAFVIASIIAWSGLFIWRAILLKLKQGDSYWDRAPYAADIFFACWLCFAFGAAIVAAMLSRRHEQRLAGTQGGERR